VIWAAGLTRAEEDFEAVRAKFGSIAVGCMKCIVCWVMLLENLTRRYVEVLIQK
jgi:hypothetical protein